MNINTNVTNLKADIKWIRQELKKVKDPTLIKALKNLLQYRKKVSSKRIDVEQYNIEIDESIAQIAGGEFYTHEEMGERIKQWEKR